MIELKYDITNEFGKLVFEKINDNKLSLSEANYILLKWFDWLNSDEVPASILEKPKEEFIIATKREYEEMMTNKVKNSLYLVELLDEVDKDKRDKIVKLLEELK